MSLHTITNFPRNGNIAIILLMYKACIMATGTTQAYLIDSLTHLRRILSSKASNKCPSVCNTPKIAQLNPKRYQIFLSRYTIQRETFERGNFRKFQGFVTSWVFSAKFGGIAPFCGMSEQIESTLSFFCENFPPVYESFIPQKFLTIWYVEEM